MMTDLIKYNSIKQKYGIETTKYIKCLEKLSKTLGRYNSHLRYNLHCKHNDVVPNYAKIKFKDGENNHEIREIIHKAEKAIMNVHISTIVKKKESLRKQIIDIQTRIKGKIETGEYNTIVMLNKKAEGKEFDKTRDRQKIKFSVLSGKRAEKKNTEKGINSNSEKWVKNISSIQLTPDQIGVLKKGGNYAITPSVIPKEEYVIATEQASKLMTKGEAAAMRAEIVDIIKKEKKPISNVTKGERRALKELKNNKDIIIAPADKGRCIVVMNKDEYMEKMNDKLKDENTYKEIKENPTKDIQDKLIKELQSMKDNGEIDERLYRKLYPNKTQLPIMYGQPKIHKEGIPLREIVDASGSITKDINKYISKIIKTYANNEYSVINSKDFVNKVKDLKLEENETLVSYDVKAMYPSIPQAEAINIIQELLHADQNLKNKTPIKANRIVSLLKICIENTYFMFNKRLYLQVNGLAIGACTSGFAADIFMYRLEKRALNTFRNPPSIWLRYVDDTFAKLKEIDAKLFMDHLNAQHERLEFTDVALKDNKIEFLDTQIIVNEERNLKIKIYKKTTHTDQYLMFDSNHHISQKLGIVATLKHRIETLITKEEDKEEEEKEMKSALKECGYPQWSLDRKKKEKVKRTETSRGKVVLPYVKGTSEKISKVLRKYNIETIHKPTKKLRNYVFNMKEKIHPLDKVGAVYHVNCKGHNESYTGETNRALKSRGYEHRVITHKNSVECHTLKEESSNEGQEDGSRRGERRSKRNTKRQDYKTLDTGSNLILTIGNTVVSEHMATHDHQKDEVTIKAIAYDNNWYTRGIREAIEIKKRKPTLNEDEGRYYLSVIYNTIFGNEDNPLTNVEEEVAETTDDNNFNS